MTTIEFDNPQTAEAEAILKNILPKAINLFIAKNSDYDVNGVDVARELGTRGQWGDMYRKIHKLKKEMWDQNGKGLRFETAEEIVQDLIGHCLLTLLFFQNRSEDKRDLVIDCEPENYRPPYARSKEYDDRPVV